jgi:hypothetical protein
MNDAKHLRIMLDSAQFHMIPIPFVDGGTSINISGYASTSIYVHASSDGWILLRSDLGSHMSALILANVSMILQSMRWWIFLIGIPHTTWRYTYLDFRAITCCVVVR